MVSVYDLCYIFCGHFYIYLYEIRTNVKRMAFMQVANREKSLNSFFDLYSEKV